MKNKIFEQKVIDYTHDGKGIVKYNNYPIFVKDCLVDELVAVKIIKWKKKYGFGKLVEVFESSKNRVVPACQFYDKCGGCQLQIMNEIEQINFKKNRIANVFNKQGIQLEKINFLQNDQLFNYRNKLAIPFKKENGKIIAGLYRENSNDIIAIDKCLIQEDLINEVLNNVVVLLNKHQINIYDKEKIKGYLRHLILRSTTNNKILVGFVINSNHYNHELDLVINELVNDQRIESIVVNFNNENTNVILGKKSKVFYGPGYIIDTINGLDFKISLTSFYQVNTKQMINLYNKAITLAELNEDDIVFDAYCGIGTISLFIAKHVKRVVGVDIVESAIEDAKDNQSLNKINNTDFICSDVQDYMKKQDNKFSCVFLDPPRKGCTQVFLDDLIVMKPPKIVYIACDPATQARDIKYLISDGYEIMNQCAIDMFSQTYHVENIISLRRIK